MCERLAQRLEEEKKDYESATLCYMCSPNGKSLHGGVCVSLFFLSSLSYSVRLCYVLFDPMMYCTMQRQSTISTLIIPY